MRCVGDPSAQQLVQDGSLAALGYLLLVRSIATSAVDGAEWDMLSGFCVKLRGCRRLNGAARQTEQG